MLRIILVPIMIMLVLSSCSKRVKETIGIVTTGPDEYQVQRNKSIEVPPHYDLPKPHTNSSDSDSATNNTQSAASSTDK